MIEDPVSKITLQKFRGVVPAPYQTTISKFTKVSPHHETSLDKKKTTKEPSHLVANHGKKQSSFSQMNNREEKS